MNKPELLNPILLDCTLRDGGYPIHFQFTSRDVHKLCHGLERAGLTHIEVGHGLGLGASGIEHGVAFETDEVYVSSAKSAVNTAKIGAFFIPGIGSFDDITKAASAGLDFIRIGTNITDHQDALPFVDFALTQGLEVHLNLMKSYAFSEDEFAAVVVQWQGCHLRSLYVVDSAGCMVPKEVSAYIRCIVGMGIKAGFHGHNNLDLVNANSLAALDAGADFVDATLRGMGRSSGNAQTEVMAHLFNRYLGENTYQVFELFDTIEHYLEPLMIRPQGQSRLEVITGISRFHTSFMPRFKRILSHYDVDLGRLIMAVSKINCIDPPEALIDRVAKDLARTDG